MGKGSVNLELNLSLGLLNGIDGGLNSLAGILESTADGLRNKKRGKGGDQDKEAKIRRRKSLVLEGKEKGREEKRKRGKEEKRKRGKEEKGKRGKEREKEKGSLTLISMC
jgi:hypothetical protein